MHSKVIVLVSHVYPPDPAAVGQHMADVAEQLVADGHRVTVLTADRGYDDPSERFQRSELRNGVNVLRLPFTSFGKASLALRLLGGISLTAQSVALALFWPRLDSILTTTTPPVGPLVGIAARLLRRVPFDYWLMDLNPDQAVALGRAAAESLQVRAFEAMNRMILRWARHIVTLDDAMAERFASKLAGAAKPLVVPAWAPGDFPARCSIAASSARKRHGFSDNRVIMYGGNHSIAHPLEDLIAAARRRDSTGPLRFVFMGGGLAKRPIDEWISKEAPGHLLSLPYQPLEQLHDYLTMADVQVVVVGPATVGIVHPSKIYGAMAAGRPILVIGPKESPASHIVLDNEIGWSVEHGDIAGLEAALEHIAIMPGSELESMGRKAYELATTEYSRSELVRRVVEILLSE